MENITLYFNVINQIINRLDKIEPVAKSRNYLYAHFEFITDEWKDKIATAIFQRDDVVYKAILNIQNECLVPWEILDESGDIFVSVYAGDLITTNKSRVYIRETGYTDEAENTKPYAPDMYSQLVTKIEEVQNDVNEKFLIIDGGNFTDWQKED